MAPNVHRSSLVRSLLCLALSFDLAGARPVAAGVGPVTPTFMFGWGGPGTLAAQFNMPFFVATDALGNLYVADSANNRIQKFDFLGNFIRQWGTSGSGNGQFAYAECVATDVSGNVYVSDYNNNRVQKFDANGNYLGQWGSFGTGNGQFNGPAAIAVDASGNVYVGDYGNNRVQRFTSAGVYVTQFGSLCSGLAIDEKGNVLVADSNNNRIERFGPTGTFLGQFGSSGSGNGQFNGVGQIATDALGDIFVADVLNNRVQKFDRTGAYLTQWGGPGTGNGQFSMLFGVTVDPSGNIYTSDIGANRIQKFSGAGVGVAEAPATFLSQWGNFGSGAGQITRLSDVAADGAGNVYVLDDIATRIQKFTSTGTYLSLLGSIGSGVGQYNTPSSVACDAAGNVYVVDVGNSRIDVFNPAGVSVTQWGSAGSGNGQFNFASGGWVTADAAGNVYVSETAANRVQKFTSTGTYLTQWGSAGSGNGQFAGPAGSAADAAGFVYVCDLNNSRIQKFTSTGTYVTQWGSVGIGPGQFSTPARVAVSAAGNVYVADKSNRIQVFTSNGTYLGTLGGFGSGNGTFQGTYSVTFDPFGTLYVADRFNILVQRFAVPPMIACVSDVPSDQGGQVRLRVMRSLADVAGSPASVLRYGVYRRIEPLAPLAAAGPARPDRGADPAGATLAGWDFVGTFDARGDSEYNIVVPTLENTTPDKLYYTAYFVSAVTADPLKSFDSKVEYGYSIDNLSPPPPSPFTAAYAAGATHLQWGVSTASDFAAFRLYRGSSAGFTPGDANRIATTTDTSYADAGAAGSWYKLSAVDLNGNESALAVLGPGQTADVAPAPAPVFALERAGANPATNGALSVRFTLPEAAPAQLALLDVAGRVVRSSDVGALGAGSHVLDLSRGSRLAPGLYFVRLTQGANHGAVRVTVIE